MARAPAILVFLGAALLGAPAHAASPDTVFSVGLGSAYLLGGEEGGGAGTGLYADVEHPLWPGRWLRPMAYAGALLVGSDASSCDPGVAPCEVSVGAAFAGAKARLRLPIGSTAPYLELGIGASAGRFTTRIGQATDASTSGLTYHVPLGLGVEFGTRRRWVAKLAFVFHPQAEQAGFGLAVGVSPWAVKGGEEAADPGPGVATGPALPPSGAAQEVPPPAGAPGRAPPVAAAGPAAPGEPPAEPPPPGERGPVALGAWLGIGGGAADEADGWTGFGSLLVLPLPMALGVGLGVPVGRSLLLGGEWNLDFGANCVASINSAEGSCNRTYLIQQLLALATVYPLWDGPREQAPGGLLIRAGAGLAWFRSRYTIIAEPDEPRPPPADTSDWRRSGAAVLAGVGYSQRRGERQTRTLDGGLDLSWQHYTSGAAPPSDSFTVVLRIGCTFH